MKIILKGSNDIYLYGDFFQIKWKSTKFPRKPMSSKMDQEDENNSPRMSKNTLQVLILQENSMDESKKFKLYATSWENLENGHQNDIWKHQ